MERKHGWLALCALLAATLVVAAVLQHMEGGDFVTIEDYAEVLGRAVGLLLISGVIPLIWWSIRKFKLTYASGPLALWVVLLPITSIMIGTSIRYRVEHSFDTRAASTDVPFKPSGCEFSVAFPATPKITQITVPQFGDAPEAELVVGESLLRAVCLPGEPVHFRDPVVLMGAVQAFAEENGLQHATYKHLTQGSFPVAAGRGQKQVLGTWMTAEVFFHVGERSVLGVTVMAPSSIYPTEFTSRFLHSVAH